MSWISSVGGLKSGFSDLGGSIFGNGSDSGLFGTGQYKQGRTAIDETAFTDTKATDARRKEFSDAIARSMGRTGALMDATQANQVRGQQQTLANAIQAQMNGERPSVAQMQMQKGLNQSLANSNTMAASARGVNPAMAMRMAQQSQATQAQDAVNNAGMLRAQENQANQQQLGSMYDQMRGQDLSTASANQQAEMQQRNLNDQNERGLREGMMTMDERDRQAKMDLGKLRVNEGVGVGNINAGAYEGAAARKGNFIGGIAQGMTGGGGLFSDMNLKTNIQPVSLAGEKSGGADTAAAAGGDKGPAAGAPGAGQYKIGEAIGSSLGGGIGKMIGSIFGGGGGGEGGGGGGSAGGIGSMIGSLFGSGGGIGGAAGGIGSMVAMSDEKQKKSISKQDAKDFIDPLTAYTYDYKDPKYGQGRQFGVMAQDLEKSKAGAGLVEDMPEGKMVDYGRAAPHIIATQAMLNDRMKKLEETFKRTRGKGAA